MQAGERYDEHQRRDGPRDLRNRAAVLRQLQLEDRAQQLAELQGYPADTGDHHAVAYRRVIAGGC